MKILYIFLLFLLTHSIVFPNDSRTVLGSTVMIVDDENTNIIMQEETINITLHRDFYEVEVDFTFFNTGEAETILLGFPVEAHIMNIPEEIAQEHIFDFRTYINSNLIPEYSVREDPPENLDPNGFYVKIRRWYLREVTFPENEYTFSRVTYRSYYNYGGFFLSAGYIYGTGANWKDKIGRMTVLINHNDDILINKISNLGVFTWEENGRYRFVRENFEPSISSQISIGIQKFDNRFGDIYEGWIWDRRLIYRDESDIRLFTRNQVRLFINYFYAFHGYEFRNSYYRDFFSQAGRLDDENGTIYQINPNFSENDFNEIERSNIDFLTRMERMIP